jgi:hypothetical protein
MEMSGQLHASAALPPEKHCIGGWVGPRAGLDVMGKIKISCPYRESKLNSSVIQPIS